jgi:hypothetical protein
MEQVGTKIRIEIIVKTIIVRIKDVSLQISLRLSLRLVLQIK